MNPAQYGFRHTLVLICKCGSTIGSYQKPVFIFSLICISTPLWGSTDCTKVEVFIGGSFGSPSVLVLYVSLKVQNSTNLRVHTNLTLRGLCSDEYGHENEKDNGHGNGQKNGHINEDKHGQGKRPFFLVLLRPVSVSY